MGEGRRSLQDRIRERQAGGFIGRQGQVVQFQENLGFPPDDEQRRFLFNIHGDAGVGKTYLAKQLQRIAAGAGALTAYIDEPAEDVPAVMASMAAEISRAGGRLGDFERRAAEYRQRRHELESDPQAPPGVAAFLTRTAVTIGLAAARDVPFAGSLLAPVDAAATADLANQAREYLARKFSDHRDVRLLLSPADELTPTFVAGLNRAGASRTVALFFDTYERTGAVLDGWLRDLYAGRYGDLPETLITTISGQKPLDPNWWGEYLTVTADVPLEPFTEAEARQFLASKGITGEPTVQVILTLSGRLPLWLATLADARRQGSAGIGDPSGNAVERFLKWEEDPARREVAVAAALPRLLNQDVLAVLTAPDKARNLFGWLRELPFVSRRGESWAYHDVVRAAMLRLRRAEAPAQWRSGHGQLAQAHDRWAAEAAETTDSTWTNPGWVDHVREGMYHLLCADPHGSLQKALASAVKAAEQGPARARQWAALIADAGRDTGNDQLTSWGQRLTDCLHGDDLSHFLTCLIDDAALETTACLAAHEERAEAYRLSGRFEEELADFSSVIELDPGSDWAFASRGETHRLMGRLEEALADFSSAIELNPRYDWALAERGYTYELMGCYDDAVADVSRAIDLNPEQFWIVRRGVIYRRMERYDEALADFSRAISLGPEYGPIVQRGLAYQFMGRFAEALADLRRAIELDPRSALALAGRGETCRRMGRLDEALADLNHAIEISPDAAWPMVSRGLTYQAMGRDGDAVADLSRAIESNPESAEALVGRGEIYGRMRKWDDALADFNRAIDLDPEQSWVISRGRSYQRMALTGRGSIYRRMKRYEDALADLSRAIELDPNDRDCQVELAAVQRLLGTSNKTQRQP